MEIRIIGGGLAGSEVALSLAEYDIDCTIFEMRPHVTTEVHKSCHFAELVCSNSLKSVSLDNASGLLKAEAAELGSELLKIAYECKVPAGKALAVDREEFSRRVTGQIERSARISVIRSEVEALEDDPAVINVVATGPLTSGRLYDHLRSRFGEALFFFDAISPIIMAESIGMNQAFVGDRYGKGDGDYINCPLNHNQYTEFVSALATAEIAHVEDFDRKMLFERCQPVEEIARQGTDALRFGPMKPVGLADPRTDKEPYAVVQLRKENVEGTLLSLVGFQTRLKWGEQRRVFSMIPALENAEFVRYGVMHRNTYLDSPKILDPFLREKNMCNTFFCGQITGLEGYAEAIASGRFVAMNVVSLLRVSKTSELPRETMLGSLIRHIASSGQSPLKPIYANFGVLPREELPRKGKKHIRELQVAHALEAMRHFVNGWRRSVYDIRS